MDSDDVIAQISKAREANQSTYKLIVQCTDFQLIQCILEQRSIPCFRCSSSLSNTHKSINFLIIWSMLWVGDVQIRRQSQ